jgi:ADP-ribose pyrophosphatase YjhB (NUDIX family)
VTRQDFLEDPEAPKANSLIPATSAIITNRGKILLQRRKDNNLWSLPGGTMEIGESIAECLKREVKEETGLEIIPLYIVGIYSNPQHVIAYPNGEIRQEFSICFACKSENGEIQISTESTNIGFFSRKEIAKLPIHPSTKQRIEDYWRRRSKATFS